MLKKRLPLGILILTVIALFFMAIASCSSKGSTEGPSSDSVISGKLQGLRKHSPDAGYSYQADFVIESSKDVGTLPNPTKDKIGQTITAETNENLKELEVGEEFMANVKLVYNQSKTGTIFYVYNVKETQ